MKPDFKLAGPEDITSMVSMMRTFYEIDGYPIEEAKSRRNLQYFIDNPGLGRCWLLLIEKKIVGYIILAFGYSFEYGGRDAFIDEIFLIDSYRGMGIGKLAMDYVFSEARGLGVKAIHLEVEKHNDRAIRLYEGAGFEAGSRILMSKRV